MFGSSSDLDAACAAARRVSGDLFRPIIIYGLAFDELELADGRNPYHTSSMCPEVIVTDDGTTVHVMGSGCVDERGAKYVGSATVVRTASGDRTVTFDAFGIEGGENEITITETFDTHVTSPTTHGFDENLTVKGAYWTGGRTVTVHYSGTVVGTPFTGRTVWNGSGTVERSGEPGPRGIMGPTGIVMVTTTNVIMDGVARVSGSTTLTDDEHTIVVTYDGLRSAHWSYDGVDQGLLDLLS